ncbi:hypothetical protein R7Q46_21435 [Vibrio sp. 811]|uniref:lipopolysaccharide biosynthesis protein n=1 Tax=Vibrio TaxID=662 RepID=UPI001BD56B59|nr:MULTISPECIES: hypothetical protein [Vibrio]EGQ9178612.1 hypothetical protein [Vibrio alginolyticus]MBS9925480.1 hypothetical protein [Vibrio alginolyticus]MDW1986967.1 hypothetical protein [Vibrio sp. 811]
MTNIKKKVLTDILRAMASNALSIFASAFIILVLPKFIGLEEYSYWQLYIFYSSYVGFLHLGWSDGFYLNNGGKNFDSINKERTSSNYYSFILFQIFLAVSIIIISTTLSDNYAQVTFYIAVCLLLTNIRSYSQFLLQATSRIKEYSSIIIIEKVTLVIGVTIVLLFYDVKFEMIILVDLLSRLVALTISSYRCKSILFYENVNCATLILGLEDTKKFIYSGFKLMFSFICSLLIFGVVRYMIEAKWGILAFGEVSLTLSLATLFVVFINSISIVLFPVLRNINEKLRKEVYIKIRSYLFMFLLILCNLYFPLYSIMSLWLPNFNNALQYLPLVFPIMLFETKTSILTNSYMKALRKESDLLKVNIFTLILSIVFSSMIYIYSDSLENCLILLVIVSFTKYVVSDYLLSKNMKAIEYKYWIFDFLFVVTFMTLANSNYEYVYTLLTLPLLPLLIYKIIK